MDNTLRKNRHRRIRSRISGTPTRPRACVGRSLTRVTVQLIDDTAHHTVAAASGKPTEVGKAIADACKKLGITQVVFDRGGYKYHGRVKAIAESMREAGLEF